MKLPFTIEEFLDVFKKYNLTVWPMQYLLAAMAIAAFFCNVENHFFIKIYLSYFVTPLALDGSNKNILTQMHPLGRFGEAKEVAELVIWLSADKASFVTGNYYAVDGGYLAV